MPNVPITPSGTDEEKIEATRDSLVANPTYGLVKEFDTNYLQGIQRWVDEDAGEGNVFHVAWDEKRGYYFILPFPLEELP